MIANKFRNSASMCHGLVVGSRQTAFGGPAIVGRGRNFVVLVHHGRGVVQPVGGDRVPGTVDIRRAARSAVENEIDPTPGRVT